MTYSGAAAGVTVSLRATDCAGDRIGLTAFGFTRNEFELHVTIEEDRFLIDVGAHVIRVEVDIELDLGDFMG